MTIRTTLAWIPASVLSLLGISGCADKHETIDFRPCTEDVTLQCGSLRVPLDYDKPRGGSISLSVIRAPASDPHKRMGVLFVNPGGPGASGLEVVVGGVHAPVVARLRPYFDIVSFDPRGSHASEAIRCDIGDMIEPTRTASSELSKLFDDFARRIATACVEQNGAIVGSMSTNNIARDIDTLRAALGEKDIVYVGLSFGTELGAVYASMFPEHVRRALLDAGVAPEFRDSYLEFAEEQAAAMERGLHYIDVLCRRDTACPLAATGVIAAVDTLVERLAASPVNAGELLLNEDTIRDVVAFNVYKEAAWPALVGGLHSAVNGDYRFFAKMAPRVGPLVRRATNNRIFDAYDAIHCNDFGTRRSADEALEIDQTAAAAYPHFYGRFYVAGELMRCAAWPAAQTPVIRDVSQQLGDRILLFGNDFDPATPLSWTRSLARALGVEANIVRYRGGGHGSVTLNVPCIDDLVVDYLVSATMPKPGTTCAARPVSFAASE